MVFASQPWYGLSLDEKQTAIYRYSEQGRTGAYQGKSTEAD